jgi:MATE family multidrug resistance protein
MLIQNPVSRIEYPKMSSKLEKIFCETNKTIQIGVPVIAAQLAQMSMGFVDTIMAGNLSAKDLAAVAVGSSLFSPMLVFVIGVLLGTNPIVAHLHGARNIKRIGEIVWQALWLSQFLALPGFFLLRNASAVMRLFNIKAEIVPISQGYLQAISWGIPAAFAFFALRYFNEGLAVTRPSMYFTLIGTVCNIIGNYIFMYGHLGLPALGAVGIGYASALAWWIMFGCMAAFTYRKNSRTIYQIAEGFKLPAWCVQKELLHIGIPNGIGIGVEVTMFTMAALIIGSLGVNTVAGHQIAINFASITFMVPLGISIATTARVGFAMGRGEINNARFIGYVGIGLSVFVMSLTALLMCTLPEVIVGMYTHDPAVKAVAVKLIILAGIFQISDGLQVGCLGALRGLKDTKIPMLFCIFAYWIVGLPTGYRLGITNQLGAEGIWIGLIIGLSVAAVLHNVRFYLLTKKIAMQRLYPQIVGIQQLT